MQQIEVKKKLGNNQNLCHIVGRHATLDIKKHRFIGDQLMNKHEISKALTCEERGSSIWMATFQLN